MALVANFISIQDVVGREDGQGLWKFCKMKNILEIKKKCTKEMRRRKAPNGDLDEVFVEWCFVLHVRSFFLNVFLYPAVTGLEDDRVVWEVWEVCRHSGMHGWPALLWGYSYSNELETGRTCLSKGVISEKGFLFLLILRISISTKWDSSKSQVMTAT